MKKLNFVLPTYNDGENLEILIPEIIEKLESFQIMLHLCDDSSGEDDSLEILAEKYPDQIKIRKHEKKLGHQRGIINALKEIVPQAPEEIFVTMDADGEDKVEDVIQMLQLLHGNKEKIVLARRLSRSRSLAYKIVYGFYSFIFRMITGVKMKTGNLACFYGSTIQPKLMHNLFNRIYSAAFYHWRADIIFYDCHKGQRYKGSTKMNFYNLVKHALKLFIPFKKEIIVRVSFILILTIFFLLLLQNF